MSILRRNEAAKLVANLLNTCAASILTVGVFTPCAVIVYGPADVKAGWALPYLALVCFCIALMMHMLAQMALWLLQEVS